MLTLPLPGAGLLFDDYHHKLLMQHSASPLRLLNSPWDMFRLIDGGPQRNTELLDFGVLAWWADVNIKGAFWRPIASATHWLDYTLWPTLPALMHAQSIAWYALLVAASEHLYRSIGVGVTAGLAALLYAVDSVHATPVGFLANRNALISALFGVLTLLAHERWRRPACRRPGAVASPLLLLLGLLAKEEAVATCTTWPLAMFLDDAPSRRLASLVPYAVVIFAWRVTWLRLGYGVSGLGLYVDPLREPLRFAAGGLLKRAPILLLSQLTSLPADLSMLLQGVNRVRLIVAALLIVGVMAAAALPALRSRRITKFWVAGMLLSVLPAATTFPSDRMLLFVGLGAMALIAQLLAAIFFRNMDRHRSPSDGRQRAGGRMDARRRAPGGAHTAVLALRSGTQWARVASSSRSSPHPLDRTIERQDLIIVNPALRLRDDDPVVHLGQRARAHAAARPRSLFELLPSGRVGATGRRSTARPPGGRLPRHRHGSAVQRRRPGLHRRTTRPVDGPGNRNHPGHTGWTSAGGSLSIRNSA